jgi:hypothetical protein
MLTALTKIDTPFMWSTACETSFKRLKKCFVPAAILHHFNPGRKIMVETDASNLIIARVLSQYDDHNSLHHVRYFSRKHSPAKINHEIYDKAPLIIIQAFKECCPLVVGSLPTIEVISDHRNLTHFTINHLLNYCQT